MFEFDLKERALCRALPRIQARLGLLLDLYINEPSFELFDWDSNWLLP